MEPATAEPPALERWWGFPRASVDDSENPEAPAVGHHLGRRHAAADHPLFGGAGAGSLIPTFSPLANGHVIGVELSYRF